ncbi:hypothetical protein AGMMS49938_08020 [Fibrobacterales bacterium]|nr:hypothetical protein AGMMS49938_08020 [Fibrobacterales bacterium]
MFAQDGDDIGGGPVAPPSSTLLPIDISGLAATKVYDGTTAATLTGTLAFVPGVIAPGDEVSFAPEALENFSATFGNPNAGENIPVYMDLNTLVGLLIGVDADKYKPFLLNNEIYNGTITPKELTIDLSGITPQATREYNGNTTVYFSGELAVSGLVEGDFVSLGYSDGWLAYSDKNVGDNKSLFLDPSKFNIAGYPNYTIFRYNNHTLYRKHHSGDLRL